MQKENNKYPTEKEIEESWEAYKKGGTALLDLLRRKEQERETEKQDPLS